MEKIPHHITVCICTYKRPVMVVRLLHELTKQRTDDLFTYSAVVVDNDASESARQAVEEVRKEVRFSIDYFCEPEQNIALARNKAVQNSTGDFLALIDDDEIPHQGWLLKLYLSIFSYNADGVLGPVMPYFEVDPPLWVVKSKLCERTSFASGTRIENPRDTRSGNVLLRKSIMAGDDKPFDYLFGKTGGEDVDFFKRMMNKGKVFFWCNEAPVYETVSQDRMKRTYFMKRALLRGVVSSKHISLMSGSALKSVLAFVLYTAALPLLFVMGQHWFMKYLVKDCDHIGKLMALCGIKLVKERSF